ncbi:MAG: ABC transporter permease [Chloroflexota bacterium]
MIRALLGVITRLLAFVGKELVEVVRRPGAVVSLILGPFLIMAIFGLGYSGYKRPLDTVVVVPPTSGFPTDTKSYQDMAGAGLQVVEVTPDREKAQRELTDHRVDVVVVAPDQAEQRFRAGQQSVIEVLVNVVDPVEANYAAFLAKGMVSEVNKRIIQQAAAEGQGYALAKGADPAVSQVPPEVVAAPTRAEVKNVAPSTPGVIAYFGPAVLALVLQHLVVSLVALSLVRERTTGLIELFRISPIAPWEVIAGKALAFGVLGAGIAAATLALLSYGLNVPMLGDPWMLLLVIGLLILASLGVGLFVAVISDSDRQAVQLSLLVLLASVFFSGFVLDIAEFSEPVRVLAYMLPVTHGIELTQEVMLRGSITAWWEVWALVIIAMVTLFASWVLLRRSMAK